MPRPYSREESLRIAKEKVRRQKEEEARRERQYYENLTTGKYWILFIITVVICTSMAVITTIETLVDGKTEKLDDTEWRIDRELYMTWHQSIKVDDYLFIPHFDDWFNHVDGTFEITYTPIFQTGKKLSYDMEETEHSVRRHTELRVRSIFTWFPYLQILMLIPLVTLFLKTQKPWFKFALVASIVIVLPGTLMITFISLF